MPGSSLLKCTKCGGMLSFECASVCCPECGAMYRIDDGVVMLGDSAGVELHIDRQLLDIHAFRDKREFFGRKLESEVEYVARLHSLDFPNLHGKILAPYIRGSVSIGDLGCGQLPYYSMFDWDSIHEYYGFDLSLESLKISARNIPPKLPVRLVYQNANEIPVSDEKFDIVISSEVLEHVEDPHRYLEEIYRICKPGGYVSLSTPCASIYLYPHRLIASLLRPWTLGRLWKYLNAEKHWEEALSWHPGLRPSVLRTWMEDAGFSVVNHQSALWYYGTPIRPAWRIFSALEKLGVTKAGSIFASYLRAMEKLLAHGFPLLKWAGIRQFILVQKKQ